MEKRSPEMSAKYISAMEEGRVADFLAREPVYSFTHWLVIENEFSYDNISKVHHLIVPKRKTALEIDLTEEERNELIRIKERLSSEYDIFWENSSKGRSVKDHYHIHLLVSRD